MSALGNAISSVVLALFLAFVAVEGAGYIRGGTPMKAPQPGGCVNSQEPTDSSA